MQRHTVAQLYERSKDELVDLARALETKNERLESKSRWFSVEQSLPAPDADFLLVAVVVQRPACKPSIDLARYDRKDGWRNQWGGSFYGTVTHWTGLPALP